MMIRKYLIYDSKGKQVNKVMLPFKGKLSIDIDKGKCCQLVENEDTEEWELYLTDI